MPRYFIAVDENRRAVILCIRGTLSLSDILTDVCAENVPFADIGVSHRGISNGAIRLKEETLETLNSLLGENYEAGRKRKRREVERGRERKIECHYDLILSRSC